jgi:hypothetical protein
MHNETLHLHCILHDCRNSFPSPMSVCQSRNGTIILLRQWYAITRNLSLNAPSRKFSEFKNDAERTGILVNFLARDCPASTTVFLLFQPRRRNAREKLWLSLHFIRNQLRRNRTKLRCPALTVINAEMELLSTHAFAEASPSNFMLAFDGRLEDLVIAACYFAVAQPPPFDAFQYCVDKDWWSL